MYETKGVTMRISAIQPNYINRTSFKQNSTNPSASSPEETRKEVMSENAKITIASCAGALAIIGLVYAGYKGKLGAKIQKLLGGASDASQSVKPKGKGTPDVSGNSEPKASGNIPGDDIPKTRDFGGDAADEIKQDSPKRNSSDIADEIKPENPDQTGSGVADEIKLESPAKTDGEVVDEIIPESPAKTDSEVVDEIKSDNQVKTGGDTADEIKPDSPEKIGDDAADELKPEGLEKKVEDINDEEFIPDLQAGSEGGLKIDTDTDIKRKKIFDSEDAEDAQIVEDFHEFMTVEEFKTLPRDEMLKKFKADIGVLSQKSDESELFYSNLENYMNNLGLTLDEPPKNKQTAELADCIFEHSYSKFADEIKSSGEFNSFMQDWANLKFMKNAIGAGENILIKIVNDGDLTPEKIEAFTKLKQVEHELKSDDRYSQIFNSALSSDINKAYELQDALKTYIAKSGNSLSDFEYRYSIIRKLEKAKEYFEQMYKSFDEISGADSGYVKSMLVELNGKLEKLREYI